MYLIIGCGYVGERVADLLHEAGHEVVGVTHSPESAARLEAAKPYAVYASDVSDLTSLQNLAAKLKNVPANVLNCASSNRGGAEMYRKVYLEGCTNLHTTFPASTLFFTSSTSVYPQIDGAWVDESSSAEPERETGRLLRATEDLVIQKGGGVARLAGIYGPSRSFVLKNFLEDSATIEGNDGEGRFLNQIHREDAARALVQLMIEGKRGIFNVVDSQPMTQRECFLGLSAMFQKPVPPVAPPNTSRKRAWTHKRVSNHQLLGLGFVPLYPSYFDALKNDASLVPSILAQVVKPADAERSREL